MSRSSPPIANYERIYDMRAKSLTRIVLTWVRRWLASTARDSGWRFSMHPECITIYRRHWELRTTILTLPLGFSST